MLINQVSSPGASRAAGPGAERRRVADPTDQAAFPRTQFLESALGAAPDLREAEVSRARELISSSPYPSDEVMSPVARLFALNPKSPAV